MNLGHTCFLHKGFCTGYLREKWKKAVTLPHIALRKHAFWGEIKEISKTKKLTYRKKVTIELLHQGLGHRSTRLLFAGDTSNV